MMAQPSSNLGFNFLQASQADKHVVMNEALELLDILVGQRVLEIGRVNAPSAPNVGDTYVVGAPAAGVWAGQDQRLAIWRGDVWQFLTPRAGWTVADASAGFAVKVFDGTSWKSPSVQGAQLSHIAAIGLGQSASLTTPFSAYLNEASWRAVPAGEGGTDDVRIFTRKARTSATASIVFQNGFSGRAETGLCGDDNYTIRVSQDGDIWRTGMSVNAATGGVEFPVEDIAVHGLSVGRGGGSILTNTRLGHSALSANISGAENTAIGSFALGSNASGGQNTAIGRYALGSNTTGSSNVAVGQIALFFNSTGTHNTAIGQAALYLNTIGTENTALGHSSLASTTSGHQNTAVGLYALYGNTSGSQNTALGRYALSAAITYSNCTGLGHNAQVTGPNQIQLGDSATTTYVFGTVQSRSDRRDKVDVRDTIHGLAFVRALRPVDFRWNYRDDYIALSIAEAEVSPAKNAPSPKQSPRFVGTRDGVRDSGTQEVP
ncbi:MAG: DUF2793 domain-containing protein [Hyphomonadaceae bacterium]|nr:DUF2793 domain-containing protein [Hyphomonadaceae bacterium]